jgi:hypothetical protein
MATVYLLPCSGPFICFRLELYPDPPSFSTRPRKLDHRVKAKLLATKDAMLIEHTAKDSYWGDGGDGRGKNMLGQILMSVRKELANEK